GASFSTKCHCVLRLSGQDGEEMKKKRQFSAVYATISTLFVLALFVSAASHASNFDSLTAQWPAPPDGGGNLTAQWPAPPDGGGNLTAQWPAPPDGGGNLTAQWPAPPDGGGNLTAQWPAPPDGGGNLTAQW